MIRILNSDFNGVAKSKEEYVKKAKEQTGIGKNSIQKRISKLIEFGILREYRGGENRLCRILSIVD